MTPVLVFDLETIPDVAGLRRLGHGSASMSDDDVVKAAQEARLASHGTDFLPLHLQRVAVVGCVFRDDQGFRVKTLGQADDPESVLIAGFFQDDRALHAAPAKLERLGLRLAGAALPQPHSRHRRAALLGYRRRRSRFQIQ
jgi:hypothetical protein